MVDRVREATRPSMNASELLRMSQWISDQKDRGYTYESQEIEDGFVTVKMLSKDRRIFAKKKFKLETRKD